MNLLLHTGIRSLFTLTSVSSSLHMRLLYAEQGNSWPHGPAHSLDAALVLIQLLHLCVKSHIREVKADCGSSKPQGPEHTFDSLFLVMHFLHLPCVVSFPALIHSFKRKSFSL